MAMQTKKLERFIPKRGRKLPPNKNYTVRLPIDLWEKSLELGIDNASLFRDTLLRAIRILDPDFSPKDEQVI